MEIRKAGLTAPTTSAAEVFISWARGRGIVVIITSGKRSRAKQRALWNARASNKYPVARPGTSDHERGIAFDAVAEPRHRQAELGQLWRDMGGDWRPTDEVHFVWRKKALPGPEAPPYTTA